VEAAKWRGRGAGRALAGAARSAGIRRISLSVERKNFAQQPSDRYSWYRIVDSSDANSDTMVRDLAPGGLVTGDPVPGDQAPGDQVPGGQDS
jgi:hypothetical protein